MEPVEVEGILDINSNERPDSILLKEVKGSFERSHLWVRYNAVPKSKFNGMQHGARVKLKGYLAAAETGRNAGHPVFRQVVSVMELR